MPRAVTRPQRPSCADTSARLHTSQPTATAHRHDVGHFSLLVIGLPPLPALPLAHRWGSLPPVDTNSMPSIRLSGRRARRVPGACEARVDEALAGSPAGVAWPTGCLG